MSFDGFPRGTFTFLRGLRDHNEKAWFEDHRGDFERYWMAPARECVEALGPKLRKVAPGIQYEPKVNGSIFRINRDVRFSKDKSPYKTNLDLWFWHGSRSGWDAPGIFIRIAPDLVMVGVGMHGLTPPQLEVYRRAVVDGRKGAALVKAADAVQAAGYEVGGATRKKVPRGFDPAHPRVQFLLHDALWAEFRGKPAMAQTAEFVDACAEHAARMWPLGVWLLNALTPTK
jgi:uncharacterized protein (TIGR02453 family)